MLPDADDKRARERASSSVGPARGFFGPTNQYDLVVADGEIAQALDPTHLESVPRHVVNASRGLVDEVVVALHLRIENDAPTGERQLPEQTLGHEQVQRVVDGRSREHGYALSGAGENLFSRGVFVREENVIRYGQPLG